MDTVGMNRIELGERLASFEYGTLRRPDAETATEAIYHLICYLASLPDDESIGEVARGIAGVQKDFDQLLDLYDADHCRSCGTDLEASGDGYDSECGTCADRREYAQEQLG